MVSYDDRNFQPIKLGDRFTVQTIKGMKGNVIGRLSDGGADLLKRGGYG